MNTTIRNLIIAAPLATAAFTMVPAAAMASEPGPVIVLPPHTDPVPDLDLVAPASEPTEPKGPEDEAPAPEPPTHPDGADDITNPDPCPTHGVDCTPGDDEPSEGDEPEGDSRNDDKVDDTVTLPNRVDAGLASQEPDGSLDVAWLFAGGLAVTASGVAFAVRRRTGSHA